MLFRCSNNGLRNIKRVSYIFLSFNKSSGLKGLRITNVGQYTRNSWSDVLANFCDDIVCR